jgi:hypothetical protein
MGNSGRRVGAVTPKLEEALAAEDCATEEDEGDATAAEEDVRGVCTGAVVLGASSADPVL